MLKKSFKIVKLDFEGNLREKMISKARKIRPKKKAEMSNFLKQESQPLNSWQTCYNFLSGTCLKV